MKKYVIMIIVIMFVTISFSESIFNFIHNNFHVNSKRTTLIINTVNKLSKEFNIDKYIIYSMIWQESNFKNLNIRYDINGNSIGYLQIHKNAYNYVYRFYPKYRKYKYNDLIYFPSINIQIGITYLYLIYKYWNVKNDIWYAISRYNGNVYKESKYEKEVYKKYTYLKEMISDDK